MQRVEAINDLFERAAGNESGEDGVGAENRRLLARESGVAGGAKAALARRLVRRSLGGGGSTQGAKAADESFVRQNATAVPAFGERAAQFIRVPSGFAEDDDLHTVADRYENRDWRSTSTLTRPAWNVRPLVMLANETSAGLKSIGSIL